MAKETPEKPDFKPSQVDLEKLEKNEVFKKTAHIPRLMLLAYLGLCRERGDEFQVIRLMAIVTATFQACYIEEEDDFDNDMATALLKDESMRHAHILKQGKWLEQLWQFWGEDMSAISEFQSTKRLLNLFAKCLKE